MTAIEVVQTAQKSQLVDKDGEPVSIELLPPLTLEEIESVQKRVGQPLPEELSALLALYSGIEGCLGGIDFTGANMSFEMPEVFPHGLPIAGDGCGNFWVVDVTPDTTKVAPVFFACHDPPVILYESPNLALFLSEVFRMYTPPHKSRLNEFQDDRLFEVWQKNPGVIERQPAMGSSDAALSSFAAKLPENFQIIDLRRVEPGMGFSWGRYGPRTEIRRSGYERIFAYGKPVRRGIMGKLFGGRS